MEQFVVETRQLCKQSGRTYRVKNLNMQVPQGCIYGFLGPNGAGKTTTMKLILGLIRPSNGSVAVQGIPMAANTRTKINRNTGSLIETPSFYSHLTGQENMEIIAKYKNLKAENIEEALKIVRMYNRRSEKVKTYSLGMKQRLGIAMALLGKPSLIVLDEPTNGLDPAGIQEIRNLVKKLPSLWNATVIISSHLLSEIEQIADYVGIINKGEMVYQGSLSQLNFTHTSLEETFLKLTGGENNENI